MAVAFRDCLVDMTGRFIVDPEKRLEIIAPDLDGFKVLLVLCLVKLWETFMPIYAATKVSALRTPNQVR